MHEDRMVELTNEEYELVRQALDVYTHKLLDQNNQLTARIVMDLVTEKFYHAYEKQARKK